MTEDQTQDSTTPDAQATNTTPAGDPVAAQEQAMLQKAVDAGTFTLPSNFKSVEEFYKSYRAMQAQATKVSQENAQLRKAQEATPEAAPAAVQDLAAALDRPAETPGSVWQSVKAELAKTGDVSPATRQAMAKAGVDADIVDALVASHKQRIKEDAAAAAQLVGGEAQLQTLLAWARDNFSPEDAKSLQAQLRGEGWRLAILGLKELHRQKTASSEPQTRIDGRPGPSTTKAQPFSSREEMTRAIADPKYRYDAVYRDGVEARILASQGMVNARTVNKIQQSIGGR